MAKHSCARIHIFRGGEAEIFLRRKHKSTQRLCCCSFTRVGGQSQALHVCIVCNDYPEKNTFPGRRRRRRSTNKAAAGEMCFFSQKVKREIFGLWGGICGGVNGHKKHVLCTAAPSFSYANNAATTTAAAATNMQRPGGNSREHNCYW